MKNAADTKAAEQSEYRRVRIDVPDAAYTATGLDYVDFECLDEVYDMLSRSMIVVVTRVFYITIFIELIFGINSWIAIGQFYI